MKYKVGDKVRVKRDLHCADYTCNLNNYMIELKGEVVTISQASSVGGFAHYRVAENGWWWEEGMLEPLNVFPDWLYKWYQKLSNTFTGYNINEVAVYAIASQGFGYNFDRKVCSQNQAWETTTRQAEYVINNRQEIIKGIIDGDFDDYLKSHNPKYKVPLVGLKTTDGKRQYLSRNQYDDNNFFASRKNDVLVQEFDYKDIPEVYQPMAQKVEDD